VVRGLHGEKYQFGAASYAGAEFASSLASSDVEGTAQQQGWNDEVPKWAQELTPEPDRLEGALTFSGAEGDVRVATVTNRQRTWEPFVVAVTAPEAWSVTPNEGTLAPRGGANNVCDPGKPYSDAIQVQVTSLAGPAGEEPAFLVIKTEEEQWTFELASAAP